MTKDSLAAFGDTVRVKKTPHTTEAGIAGLEGTVYGFTTPSVTGIAAIGPLADDFAINVHIDALDQDCWLDQVASNW
jgi:hypothetical protein